MFGIGPTELLVIFLVIIIFFGAKRLPELARSLGRSIKEFKQATQGLADELDITDINEKTLPRSTTPPQAQTPPEETPTKTETGTTSEDK